MYLKVYCDQLSQPCRAIITLLEINQIKYERSSVNLRNGEQKSQNYLKINPFGKVPAIEHNGFYLTESSAILKYICRYFHLSDDWYPQNDLILAAKIDEFISWHQVNLRTSISKYFKFKILLPNVLNKNEMELIESEVRDALNQMENVWLKNQLFVCGTKEPSISDLLAICELEQLVMADYGSNCDNFNNVASYISRVKSKLGSLFENINLKAHKLCNDIKLSKTKNFLSKL